MELLDGKWFEMFFNLPVRIAADREVGTCPVGQGSLPVQGVTAAREGP
jgi:hypothetical protein